jgi:HD-GYP domain-containing protein (c-di-GMP phosphodiesterase class II)
LFSRGNSRFRHAARDGQKQVMPAPIALPTLGSSGTTKARGMNIEVDLHGMRTAWLTARLCAVLDVAPNASRDWAIAALTHDIGKLDIPPELLGKPGALDGEERCIVERHCIAGAKRLMARASPDGDETTTAAVAVALSHHERWNGQGYPFGLAGNAIPRCARIVAVADVIDALTSVRPYKAAWSLQAALDEVSAQRARQFEPDCVDAMEILAGTLPADWRAIAQAWGLRLTLELGRPARAMVGED